MFKFKRYDSGLRKIYLGNICIFKYRNLIQTITYPLRAIRKDLERVKNEINGHNSWLKFELLEALQSKEGIYHFQSLLRRSYVAGKYYPLFYDFHLRASKGEELVIIDAGAHAGVFRCGFGVWGDLL